MNKELQDKAISIKGKQYVLVSDRVLFFNENFTKGCISTELVKWEGNTIIVKATVYPEGLQGRFFTGYSQAIVGEGYINKTAALENAETSAVGRALGFMGIGVIDGIASVDEIYKAENSAPPAPKFSQGGTGNCKDCGGKMIMSSKGKIYCENKCWLKKPEVKKVESPDDFIPEYPF